MQPHQFPSAVLSAHARTEIARRGLPADQVSSALAHPDQVLMVRTGRVVLHKRYESAGREYLLRLFVDFDREPPVVVTLYRTSKIEKYWSTDESQLRSRD